MSDPHTPSCGGRVYMKLYVAVDPYVHSLPVLMRCMFVLMCVSNGPCGVRVGVLECSW